ncbi:MAG: hypothetical protein HKN04_06685 [Rhodothermaceae bacterium]|nr:hypothetical protein [Rhodothermaceae bacterium]
MALYEPKEATLNGIEGEGYAYVVDTYQGKAYRGVFFADEDADLGEAAGAEEPVSFEGTVYHKTTEGVEALDVTVTKTVNVSVGTRADFEVVAG